MVIYRRRQTADPDGDIARIYDSDYPAPVITYTGSEIDPEGTGSQVARPMIQILRDHSDSCWMCESAAEGERLIVVD